MHTVFNLIMLICLIGIPCLHFLPFFVPKFTKVLNLTGIILNVVALIPLVYFGAELELVFMLYMLSLALRQIAFLIFANRRGE